MNKSNEKKIVHIGVSGFPFGGAAVNRCTTIYSQLIERKFEVLFVNNRTFGFKSLNSDISKKGEFKGIKYIYTTPSPYKSKNFILRRWYNLVGPINEFILIIKFLLPC